MSMIMINNISASYSKGNVIEDICIQINEKELVGVLGVNGSGKSTLAKAICNIMPHKGEVIINNQKIENLNFKQIANIISYVPQNSGIGIDISLLDVVMMGFNSKLKLLENPNKAMENKAKEILSELGLEDKIYTNYVELSEGQKQLAILSRALVNDGNFLVLDEPESALDFSIRFKIMKKIKSYINCENRAGLVILHDTNLALNNCDRLVLLKDKKIVGTIDLHNDTIESIKENLSKIYGDICLVNIKDKNSKNYLSMIYNSEDV